MPLELSRRAQADLDDIRDYSLEQFGVERAILYLDAIGRFVGCSTIRTSGCSEPTSERQC